MTKQSTPVSRLAEIVEILKRDKGLNQAEIAGLAGLSPSNLSHYIKGRSKNINRRTLEGFQTAFDVNSQYIRTGKGEPFTGGQIKALEPSKNSNEGDWVGSHIKWLVGQINDLNGEITDLGKRGGPFSGDLEVARAVESLDQTDYNTIRDLILGFAWWARRHGTQEIEPDVKEKKKPVRV